MIPIRLVVRKKRYGPTKNNIVHQFRAEYPPIFTVNYEESARLIRNIDGTGKLHTDAQFAYWLFKHFGEGEYSVIAWRLRRKGFWSFMKVHCGQEGYLRLQKKQTPTDKEKMDLIAEYRKLKRKKEHSSDDLERGEYIEEMEQIKDSLDVVDDMLDLEKTKQGCYPYLMSMQPIYKFHEYQSLDNENYTISSATAKDSDEDFKAW